MKRKMSQELVTQMENTTIKFTYVSSDGRRELGKFPYRVGDYVKVRNWGSIYSTYSGAFMFFGLRNPDGRIREPFYSNHYTSQRCRMQDRIFKIMDIAEHETYEGRTLFLIKDNQNQEAVVGEDGLKPFKAYPLRDNETKIVEIKRIKT